MAIKRSALSEWIISLYDLISTEPWLYRVEGGSIGNLKLEIRSDVLSNI